ncbi:UDP-glucosesterol glycosyltransferase [Blumeria hordei DH14]|uniref:Sterol 3-beta-glucosyltransferase n=1 Tax=Blumeria graminis f. sp. hordei (strain DH14) TaxID=546991 RepID=N1J7B4_BLUG1|nr:UDP-glucosesterol glycosyltransferase [Blumeria hordei DH14]
MEPEEESNEELSHRLAKHHGAHQTNDIPERFQDGDDADEDCTALSAANSYMNQSVFGMIAAAGSQIDFNARFDAHSSDDNEEDTPRQSAEHQIADMRANSLPIRSGKEKNPNSCRFIVHPCHKLVSKSMSGSLPIAVDSISLHEPTSSPAQIQSRTCTTQSMVMSRMLKARENMSLQLTPNSPHTVGENAESEKYEEESISNSLSKKLMEIFQFETPEQVIEEFPCWLMKSALLQGYMYITTKHISFYAYLPKRSNEVVKSGYLSKSGRRNPKYNRYWFRLKGDVLSYYTDPSDLYFPRGNIDLRYGISATLQNKENSKNATSLTLVTHQREYKFKADSTPSAKEWVKALQKIIFRSHNEGDSVKISIPIENIMDIEESHVIEFAETCKIRVVDNDDTYAVDEYFFSFFSFGKEALKLLRGIVEDTAAQHIPKELLKLSYHGKVDASEPLELTKRDQVPISAEYVSKEQLSILTTTAPLLEDSVRATLSPLGVSSPPVDNLLAGRCSLESNRKSIELKNLRRRSADLIRQKIDGNKKRSMSTGRKSMCENCRAGHIICGEQIDEGQPNTKEKERVTEEVKITEKQCLFDSYVHSLEEPSSTSLSNSDNTYASGSQILKGTDVFLTPTIQRATPEVGICRKGKEIEVANLSSTKIPVNPHITDPKLHDNAELLEQPRLDRTEPLVSTQTLHSIVKVGAYPLQRAAGLAGYLNRHSKRMSNLLATESMGYVEKVSGMWKGGRKHYDDPRSLGPDDHFDDGGEEDVICSSERFREHFALPEIEKLQATYFGFLNRVLPLYGKIYISDRSFCFRSLLPATSTKLILPLKDIENVDKEKGFRFGYSGLVIVIKAHEELFFEFSHSDTRDDCAITLLQNLETLRYLKQSGLLTLEEKERAEDAIAENKALQQARSRGHGYFGLESAQNIKCLHNVSPPVIFDDPRSSILDFKPLESLRITCLTIGSRGDVQPYIALCKGLIFEGHQPTIATHLEFKDWVESYGIKFKPVSGDPAELMRICIENGMFTYSFLKEASSKFRGWIDELLTSAWDACQGSDILIESPSAMGGIHIAEALRIPYFRAFTMPWTRTRAYPHAFAVPEHKMGGAYNYISYVMFDNVFWKAISGQVNRWRKKELGLHATNLEKMQPNKVPFLYNFSPAVVVPPLDYSDWIRVTGYWFLDEGTDWTPPKELTEFIAKAREDGKKLVYIGFGSIIVQDSVALMNTITKSVEKADVRCILSRGWSDRLQKDTRKVEPPLPTSILKITSAPHDWLFKQIDAAAHHGGAGTTGASLRAGIPTIVKPFFGDQYFFGSRVEDLGVGIIIKKLNTSVFSRALWLACNDERMIFKAKALGKTIRKEDGVSTAIQSIYRDLEYARSLIKLRDDKIDPDDIEDAEESWTFIGEDNDPDLVRRVQDWKSMSMTGTSPWRERSEDDSDGSFIRKELEVVIGATVLAS